MNYIAGIFITLFLIVTSEAITVTSDSQTCTPIQGCDVTIGDSCYAHVDDSLNWNQAEDCCVAWGGHLASIHSSDVNTILNSIRNLERSTWIGLSDTANDGVYVWTDGTQYDYENFAPGQPNSGSGESCFFYLNGALTWHDYLCSSSTLGVNILTSYICQKTHVPPTAVTNATYMTTSTPTSITTNMTTSIPDITTSTATNTTNISPNMTTSMTTSIPDITTSTATNTTDISTNITTNMTTSMTTSITTNTTTSIPDITTSTATNTTTDLLAMYEARVAGLLDIFQNLSVGEIVTEFNREINADIIAVHVDSNSFTNITFESVTVGMGSDSFQANAIIVSAVYRNTSDFTSSDMILSDIITIVSLEELSGNLTITFTIIQILQINDSSCYSFQNGTWVTDGIETTRMGNTVICETSHLTTFAVLIDPTLATAPGDHSQYQAYISVILCGLSLVALLTTIILYLCLGKKFYRKDINIIQLNFVIALCFALITFFLLTIPYFGMTALPPQACGAIAMLTQYCWLSVFSWNFCQVLHIILALFENKLPFRRHYIPLILIGWGIPIPIVLVTLGVGLVQGEYQHEESCFLSTANGLIWAFLGPIFFILLINTCILTVIIIVSIYVQRKRKHKLAYSWRLVIGIATTILLLGLPWVVGLLLRVIPNTDITFIVVNYIFIIVNASQGLIFFVAHVIGNQEIRTLCSSSLKADIDINPDDKEKKERESIDVISTNFSNNMEKNEKIQNDYTDRV